MESGLSGIRFGVDQAGKANTPAQGGASACCGGKVCFCGKSSGNASNGGQCCGGSVCFCGNPSSKVPADVAFAARSGSGYRPLHPLKLAQAITNESRSLRAAEAPFQAVASRINADRNRAAYFSGMSAVDRQILNNQAITDHTATLGLARMTGTSPTEPPTMRRSSAKTSASPDEANTPILQQNQIFLDVYL